jgi:phosphatidylcholine synthase
MGNSEPAPDAKGHAPSPTRQAAGWAVHVLTASGAFLALLSMLAIIRGDARAALLWLGVALAIDGLDGPMARKLRIRDVIPRVDGAVLDLVVDYLTYVLVPAIFIYWFGLLPNSWSLAGAGFILVTSLYCFANTGMKTHDNYFVGFPAIWNVVALYMWILGSPTWINALVVFALGVLTFVPMKFVHPIRVRDHRDITYAATLIWALCSLGLVLIDRGTVWLWLYWPWIAASVWLGFISLRRTFTTPAER